MLTDGTIREVRRLLDEGEMSYRQIAARVHCSRGTVVSVAKGKRAASRYEPRQPNETPGVPNWQPSLRPTGSPQRCPECGGMVYMPCAACAIKSHLDSKRLPAA